MISSLHSNGSLGFLENCSQPLNVNTQRALKINYIVLFKTTNVRYRGDYMCFYSGNADIIENMAGNENFYNFLLRHFVDSKHRIW
jgi:hypothetical protein